MDTPTTTAPDAATSTDKLGFLLDQLNAQIGAFEIRRRRNKRRAFWLKIATTGLSVGTTILLGITTGSASLTETFKNAALMMAGFVSILSAWDAFFNHKELWIRYKATSNNLKGLRALVEYRARSSKGLDEEGIDALFVEFQRILRESNSAWQRMRDEPKEARPGDKPPTAGAARSAESS